MELKPGDILFIHGTDWISRCIERITKSKYSHVCVYVGDAEVIEAQGFRNVGYQQLEAYAGRYDVYRVPMTYLEQQLGLFWLLRQRGRKYDYWDIFVLFLRCVFRLKIPWHEGHRILCSRLVRDFLRRCVIGIPDENMTPEDLFEWVKAHGYQVSA